MKPSTKVRLSCLVAIGFLALLFGSRALDHSLRTVDFRPLSDKLTTPAMQEITVSLDGTAYIPVSSELTLTYVRANEIGLAVSKKGNALPGTSLEVSNIALPERLDAWGNPFCIGQLGEFVIVMSFRPNHSVSDCSHLLVEVPQTKQLKSGFFYVRKDFAFVVVPRG